MQQFEGHAQKVLDDKDLSITFFVRYQVVPSVPLRIGRTDSFLRLRTTTP